MTLRQAQGERIDTAPIVEAPQPILVELLADVMALARKIEAHIDAAAGAASPAPPGIAEGVARDIARHFAERSAASTTPPVPLEAPARPPAPAVIDVPVLKRPNFVSHRTMAEVDGLPGHITIDQSGETIRPEALAERVPAKRLAPAGGPGSGELSERPVARRRPAKAAPKSVEPPPAPAEPSRPAQPSDAHVRFERLRQAGMRSTVQRLEAGGKPRNQVEATLLKTLEGRRADAMRMATPIGQAVAFLQKRMPVYRAEVAGGPAGKWVVGRREPMTEDELLELARIRGWEAAA